MDVNTTPSQWLGKITTGNVNIEPLFQARSWAEIGQKLLPAFLSVIFLFAIILAIFLVVKAGFQFIFSQGEKENVEKARTQLTNALIGLVLVLGVFLIFNVIQRLIGVDLQNPAPQQCLSGNCAMDITPQKPPPAPQCLTPGNCAGNFGP